MKLEPLIQVESAWTCVSGRFGVHVFEGHLTIAQMDRMESFGDRWYRSHPGPFAELVVVLESNARMTSEERARMARLIKRWEGSRIASATVIMATGLTGAFHRSVLTGLMMLAPPPHPAKVFGSVPGAITWLHPYVRKVTDETVSERDVLAAAEELCRVFQARNR